MRSLIFRVSDFSLRGVYLSFRKRTWSNGAPAPGDVAIFAVVAAVDFGTFSSARFSSSTDLRAGDDSARLFAHLLTLTFFAIILAGVRCRPFGFLPASRRHSDGVTLPFTIHVSVNSGVASLSRCPWAACLADSSPRP